MPKGEGSAAAPEGDKPAPAVKAPDKVNKPAPAPRPTRPKATAVTAPKKDKKDDEKKEEKCQPPGPNVDPFGAPICKN